MECTLCREQIKNYDPSLNHLNIDDAHSAEICLGCTDKIIRWQQGIYARLYPTKAAKKRFGNEH